MPGHVPVLLAESIGFLAPERGGCFVDCTVGLGGHSRALLEATPTVEVIGIDRDAEALAIARERLSSFGDRVRLVRGAFSGLRDTLTRLSIDKVDGVFADIGVSSLQLDDGQRGFAFARDGPLDMRMTGPDIDYEPHDPPRTAASIVNEYPEDALRKLLYEYGEERQARRIARAIVRERTEQPIETTGALRDLIERTKTAPPSARRRIHPATKTFQALRIEVNQELEELRRLTGQAAELLREDGRMVVISYHSLEDRIVKNALRDLATGDIDRVTGRPRAESRVIEVLTKKPVRPGDEEVADNPRARSARLRAGRRI